LDAKIETIVGSQSLISSYAAASPLVTLSVQNEAGYTAFIEVLTADVNGLTAPAQFARFREVYIWGAQGTRQVTT
jgi:hypothetical protein